MSADPPQHGERTDVPAWLVAAGLPIGFLSSLAGIGGGIMTGSLLHFLLGFDLRRATGTALVLVLATTAGATATEAFQADSALHGPTIGALVLGVLVGAVLGFVFSERAPDRLLRVLFAVVLAYSSWRVLFGNAAPGAGVVSVGSSGAEFAWSAFVGLLGGFAAPILGVGGGLVMVPGLFLGVGGLGFDGARACSLAAGVVAAILSLFLKNRAGRVSWRHGTVLGIGALVGAGLGVISKGSFAGLLEFGRITLGVILAIVALRFARDVLRSRKT